MKYFISEDSLEKLFVLFHGTGGNEFSLLFLTGELDIHGSVISFLGNRGEGQNRRYFSPLINGELEVEDFNTAVEDFLVEWDKLALDYQEIIFIGYSNGANFIQGILQHRPDIANQTLLLHPQEFNLEFSTLSKSKNRLLLTTGANDTLSIPGEIVSLTERLKGSFEDVTLLLTDGRHEVSSDEVDKIKEWYLEQE